MAAVLLSALFVGNVVGDQLHEIATSQNYDVIQNEDVDWGTLTPRVTQVNNAISLSNGQISNSANWPFNSDDATWFRLTDVQTNQRVRVIIDIAQYQLLP